MERDIYDIENDKYFLLPKFLVLVKIFARACFLFLFHVRKNHSKKFKYELLILIQWIWIDSIQENVLLLLMCL